MGLELPGKGILQINAAPAPPLPPDFNGTALSGYPCPFDIHFDMFWKETPKIPLN